ncbi:hypothetical protein [Geoalkalibacter halelectricus]|uniref:Uncharacterized protein n=1 Tax=Geoalkalibacter halelectricus TaxID=2847045 RepID=A0ABY5ZPA1_9BACT|nr:hypothetical protein [Geoalkalibacter halelectricus]MDO3377593.1 hypothetical protein [Geoalkalibacter halelectricus]UWZ80649.1 hypothetical protein L9S41_04430 [Geoalkalibacter halelectricus]
MWRIALVFAFFLTANACFAGADSSRIAREVPWPPAYQGESIALSAADVSISIPNDIVKLTYDEMGVLIQFSDNSFLGIKIIDEDFFRTDFFPDGIRNSGMSVSFVGKIPFLYTRKPSEVTEGDESYDIWRYGIAQRTGIYKDNNLVKKSTLQSMDVFYYQPSAARPLMIAQIHSQNEDRYLMLTVSGMSEEKFTQILGTLKSLD